jgi:hypothetical protein
VSGPIVRWYVSNYSSKPERKEFVRETDKFLIRKRGPHERREAKVGSYYAYHATEEAALAAIEARKAREANKAREFRIRDAAPELLAFAEWILSRAHDESQEAIRARAAIAKAAGNE